MLRYRFPRLTVAAVMGGVLLFAVAPAVSATPAPTGNWTLKGSLHDSAAGLFNLDTTPTPDSATFETMNVKGKYRPTFAWAPGQGLLLTGVPTQEQSTYTIEVLIEFDAVGPSYERIMSFGDVPTRGDAGLYYNNGHLEYYPHKATNGSITTANKWTRLRVTRNGTTKVMKFYVNGVQKMKYTDNQLDGVLVNGTVQFFLDDGGEDSGGHAAKIEIWPAVVAP